MDDGASAVDDGATRPDDYAFEVDSGALGMDSGASEVDDRALAVVDGGVEVVEGALAVDTVRQGAEEGGAGMVARGAKVGEQRVRSAAACGAPTAAALRPDATPLAQFLVASRGGNRRGLAAKSR